MQKSILVSNISREGQYSDSGVVKDHWMDNDEEETEADVVYL